MSAVCATEVLASPSLPLLISQITERLEERYRLLSHLLDHHDVEYVPCNAGIFILVRIAPRAECQEDEDAAVSLLREAGIAVAPGSMYHMPEIGWARICFAVEDGKFHEAMRRLDTVFASRQMSKQVSSLVSASL